jgi:hypothetical protein
LQKIVNANGQVTDMKIKLGEQETQLHIAQQHSERMPEGLTMEKVEAEGQPQEIMILKEQQ